MLRVVLTALIAVAAIFFFSPIMPDARPDEKPPNAGIIRIPERMAPDECYVLFRGEKSVRPLVHDMPVFNGDVVIPFEGKIVRLIYRHDDCGQTVITRKTVINCDPREFATAGGFMNLLPDAMKKTIEMSKQNTPRKAPSGPVSKEKRDKWCFPDDFPFSPWPLEGGTVLHGEPILFRWAEISGKNPCSEVKLCIFQMGENPSEGAFKADMRIGELVRVKVWLQEKTTYEWYVESEGQKISESYRFRILDKETSDNIRSQLAEVAGKYGEMCPGLRQALYLQIISESTPKLDLHADSFRLMWEYRRCQKERLRTKQF